MSLDGGQVVVDLLDGEHGVARGQACVLYSAPGDEARVLGGGFIERTDRGASPLPSTRPERDRAVAG